MIPGPGRSIKTIGGTRLRLRSTGKENGYERWDVYVTAQRVPGGNEVTTLDKPRRIGRISEALLGRATFAQPEGSELWVQDATVSGAARLLGQLVELGMI